jgi:hypothetical protein
MSMYELPTKGDLDRNLSMIMHSAHRKARAERGRLTSEFAARGMVLSTSLIGAVIGSLNEIHAESIEQAMQVLRDFVERMQIAPTQITSWARPHLENLGNTVLGQLPPAGFPAEQQRVRAQYALVFQQRLDGALRDIEIGFIGGASVTVPESMRPAPSAPSPKELLSLKPALWGFSIDLKELWRRFRNKARTN